MVSILEKIFQLKELERNLFYDKLESENKIPEFLIVLKYSEEGSRELFLKMLYI